MYEMGLWHPSHSTGSEDEGAATNKLGALEGVTQPPNAVSCPLAMG